MPSCEKNILEIPVSPTAPSGTDYQMWHLPDGTTVLRQHSTAAGSGLPDDDEYTTLETGSNTDNFVNGNNEIFLTNFVGKRIRVYRSSVLQSVVQGQITWNKPQGLLIVSPAPVTGEIWQIQAY